MAKQFLVRAQWGAIWPCEPRRHHGSLNGALDRQFEQEVVAQLIAVHPDAHMVAGEDQAGREAAMLAVMRGFWSSS